jgi:hypothetical protein
MQQLDPLRTKLIIYGGDASEVAAGFVEGGNEAGFDRIDADVEHDRDGGRCFLGREHR